MRNPALTTRSGSDAPEKQPLPIGTVFDTPAESGCVVTSLPDADGNFLALDSDGVECWFSRVMVARVHQ